MNFQLNLNVETIDHAYPTTPLCVEPQTSLREVLRLLKQQGTGSLLVCQDNVLKGIFTERDALKLMAGRADLDTPIEKVMACDPVTLSPSDTVGKGIAKMSFGGYRRLPIVDDGGCAGGIVKVSGILRYLVEHFPNVVYTLPPKPHHTTQQREGA